MNSGTMQRSYLDPKQVGAYLFKKDGSCENLEVSATGFSIESIDAEIRKSNTDSRCNYIILYIMVKFELPCLK
jgi:hypothetical protein